MNRPANHVWIARPSGLFIVMVMGCSSPPQLLMPTPNIYCSGQFDPFENVPTELQNNRVGVLYYTDRAPEKSSSDSTKYGYKRSRSAAFGISELELGHDVSWEKL